MSMQQTPMRPGPETAGCRPVRRLSGDERWLVDAAASSPPQLVEVRRVTDRDAVGDWARAATRVSHPHLPALHDLADAGEGGVAVVTRAAPGWSVAELLERRAGLDAGELVTICAPILDALGTMHAAGVVARGVTAERIRFDARGTPLLDPLPGILALPAGLTPAAIDARSEVVADRAEAMQLVERLADRLPVREAALVRVAVESSAGVPAHKQLADLAARLFALAPGSPVHLDEDPAGSAPEPLGPRGRADVTRNAPVAPAARAGLAGAVDPMLVMLAEAVPSGASLRGAVRARWSALDPRRRRIAVAAAAGAAAAILAVLLIPAEPPPSTSEASRPTESSLESSGGAAPGGARPSASPAPAGGETAAVEGDDPLAAAPVLLATRERCLRDRSIACLEAVLQPGSVQWHRDRELLEAIDRGGGVDDASVSTPWDPSTARAVDRVGDLALLATGPETPTASLLVMRSEAGWRIREIVPGAGADPG
ncbi:hypothetical protein [Homoserinibacter sp. YIM 151385]|uniref:hypothetical protein n=1 Tax=Homoserinibacter sp. YIM 151385 TaxID=2985506 RepID=UPI0022F0AC65|nr:hypothetical protein [Homoserinibacter sp. YIM 151385]WBU38484.1 hypothetical protein OF852_02555 [Homoserinibacter sp. YIM 151385]